MEPELLEKLGPALRAARERLGVSLEEVERETLVRSSYLAALERDRFHELPPDIYVRRIIRTYAAYLGLPAAPLIASFFREREAFLKMEQRFEPLNLDRLKPAKRPLQSFAMPTFFNAPRVLAAAAGLLALVLVTGYFALQVNQLSAAPKLELAEPKDGVTIAHRTVLIRGATELGASVAVNNQRVLTDESGHFSVPFELADGTNTITVLATDKHGRATRVVRTISADVPEEAVPARPASGFVAALSVTAPAWVSVELDGKTAFEGLLPKNGVKEFAGKETLSLRTGNAGVTRLAINGEDQGVLGRTGQVATYNYDRKSVVARNRE